MAIDTLEKNKIEQNNSDVKSKLGELHGGFESTVDLEDSCYGAIDGGDGERNALGSSDLAEGIDTVAYSALKSSLKNYKDYKNGDVDSKNAFENVLTDATKEAAREGGKEILDKLVKCDSTAEAGMELMSETLDDLSDYNEGKITKEEVLDNFGENAARAAGKAIGGQLGGKIGGKLGGELGEELGEIVGEQTYKATKECVSESKEDFNDYKEGKINEIELAKEIGDNIVDAAESIVDGTVQEVSERIDTAAATVFEVGVTIVEKAVYVVEEGINTETVLEAITDVASDIFDIFIN